MRQPGDALKRLAAPLLLAFASLLVYGRTVSYPFVLDDPMVIVRNEFLRSPANLPLLLVSDYSRGTSFGPGYFRPLMMITFALQGILLGWNPVSFHLVNVLLHALTAWSIYLAARAVGCRTGGALVGALLFTVFPPGQDAVGSIVGRCDILATLFLLLGWRAQVLWQRGQVSTLRACAWVFGFGLLAMLGKENGAVYAAAAGLTSIFFLVAAQGERGPQASERGGSGQVLICVAAFAALAAYLVLRHVAAGGIGLQADVAALSSNPVASLAQPERTYAALYGTGRLLLALLGTAPLSVPLLLEHTRPFPIFGPFDPRVLVPAVLLGLLAFIAGRLIWRGQLVGVALALFLLNLVPTSNLLIVGATFVGERFLYLPFAGLALAAAIGWDRASVRIAKQPPIRWAGLVLVGGLLVDWGCLASERATAWKSEAAIADSRAQLFPWQAMWWNRSGLLAMERGALQKARDCFERSVAIDPNDGEVLGHLGMVLGRMELWKDSSQRLRRATELLPADPEIRAALARALLAQGEKQAGLEEAQAAYALRPSLLAGHHTLATALFENGRYGDAAREFQLLLLDDPGSAPLHHAYILSLYREGRLDAAEAAARDASQRVPADPRFNLWSARLATRLGRRDQAIADLWEAKRKNGPVALWLEQVDDLRPLRDDPRARALAAAE